MSKITRRTFIGTASAAAVTASSTAGASSDELAGLIEAHRAAYDAFVEALDHEQDLEAAYEKAHPDAESIIVPSLLGGGVGIKNGYEDCRLHIARVYETQRERLTPLSRVSPDLAEQVRATLHAKEAENMEIIDRVFAEEEARKEAFGLAGAQRAYRRTTDAEEEAALALCAYPCRTLEEARLKAEYLATQEMLRDGLQPEQIEALLQSFRVEAVL